MGSNRRWSTPIILPIAESAMGDSAFEITVGLLLLAVLAVLVATAF